MIELSVLCDRFYAIEQGYVTGERGYKLNMVRMIDYLFYVTDFILLDRATL
jgi:hypothetical protein